MGSLVQIYWVWGLAGGAVLVAGWFAAAKFRERRRRQWTRAVLGALAGSVAYFGVGHGAAFPVPAVMLLFSDGYLFVAIWIALWALLLRWLLQRVSPADSRYAPAGLAVAVAMPLVFIGVIQAVGAWTVRQERAETVERWARQDAAELVAHQRAQAALLARAQTFAWVVDEAGAMTLIVSPGLEPLAAIHAPPAPAAGIARIRGLPGAALPQDPALARAGVTVNSHVWATTATAFATGAVRADLSYGFELTVAAGERIELTQREVHTLDAGRRAIQAAPQTAGGDDG